MLNFSFNVLGVGLAGNENVYFATIIRYNDYMSALVILKENDLFSNIVNTIIGDVKETWEGAADVTAFVRRVNLYTKYRIMPFSISWATENDKMTIDEVAVEAKNRCLKFFTAADILIKDKAKKKEAVAV